MDPERWQQIDSLLGDALERPQGERAAFLAQACPDDEDLRRTVAALLNSRDEWDFLDKSALEVVARTVAHELAREPRSLLGRQLGPYTVVAFLGAGGMGEVYRAHDSRLGRDVAIKVLPDAFARDPDRLARFTREAHVLASLNHPNVAAIYSVEESQGVQALVLELVEGTTLADRIAQGPIPFREALPIARQIADALAVTHEHGIIHRDLKPSNIKLRPDGTVKVLDFGLARTVVRPGGEALAAHGSLSSLESGPLAAPVLGTPAYMSPEQAMGKSVDKRADIWAFGCVFYEMSTGRRAFGGHDPVQTIAAVIGGEPDWTLLPEDVPVTLRGYLRRCVHKEPKERVQDMRDLRLALEGAFDFPAVAARVTSPDVGHGRWRASSWAMAAVAAVLVSGGSAWFLTSSPPEPSAQVRRFTVDEIAAPPLAIAYNNRDLALTPDGTRLVYFAGDAGDRQLYVRVFDELEPKPVRRAERFFEPFISPDGRWVGFNDESDFTLTKIAIEGGPPIPIAKLGTEILGATWGSDDTIVFGRNDGTGLWAVPATGGVPRTITTVDGQRQEVSHRWPEFLPGGKHVLFTIVSGPHADRFQIAAVDLETREQKILVSRGSGPQFSDTGHLLFVIEDVLYAVAFDTTRLETLGNPVPVMEDVSSKESGAANYSLSRDGSLAYVHRTGQPTLRTLVWVDRDGREEPIEAPPRTYVYARLSPDGRRVALDIRDQENDIWLWDLAGRTFMRLTLESTLDRVPVWTSEGRILFSSNLGGPANLFSQAVDGTSTAERVTRSPNDYYPTSISPDGTIAVITDKMTQDVMMLALNGDRSVRPLVQTPFIEDNGEISPDGRWLAYESNQSGQYEVYVRPFPAVSTGQWQISTQGGTRPLWARSGRELFYVGPTGALMSVAVRPARGWAAGAATPILEGGKYFFERSNQNTHRTYDVASDGRRFLVIKPVVESTPPVRAVRAIVVLNWDQELKRLVPTR